MHAHMHTQVVILPIFWNIKSRLAEKEIIMKASAKVGGRVCDQAQVFSGFCTLLEERA